MGFGKLDLVLIGNYIKGAETTPNGGTVLSPTNGFSGVFNSSNPTAFNGTATIMDRTLMRRELVAGLSGDTTSGTRAI